MSAGIQAIDVAIAVDASGQMYVAWQGISPLHIYVKRWNGTAWEELAGSASTGGVDQNGGSASASAPEIVVDDTGRAIVAWNQESGSTCTI